MNIKVKISGAMAIGALLASVAFPSGAFAATNVTIDHNGTGSSNGVAVINVSKSKVKQKNTTIVGTSVLSVQNTGGNKSSFNNKGNNSIDTGKNTTTTNVNVAGGTNTNTSEDCCCDGQNPTTVNVTNNGALSHNGVLVVDVCKHSVKQSNTTVVGTEVTSIQNTGGNNANFNTGGNNTIETGDNTTITNVTVTGSSNSN